MISLKIEGADDRGYYDRATVICQHCGRDWPALRAIEAIAHLEQDPRCRFVQRR